ncbi:D-2-hydroxyacid dehydrogenase [Postechiella marina]|uniref:D-2-hydroxyacid dehydrogenase n=1 Tax=Postechiella marina TaxID=943941 RepID=A0ABP8CG56_9FLAO
MKIVVLDGYTLNPGDLSWDVIKQYGALKVFDRTNFNPENVIKTIGDADIVFTNKTPLPKTVIEQAPNLKYIGVLATGYNVVDVVTAKKLNITVSNVPGYGTNSVAQFTMALLLEMCHNIGKHSKSVHNGDWIKSPDFCFWNSPLVELKDKTLGIIGFGNIGQATAKMAEAFGLNIIVYSRTVRQELESENCTFVSLEELLQTADIISLHCPLFEETKGIINADNISKMKDGVKIINTSRGPLIVEEDLKNALNSGKISSAALDVISKEPMSANNPLLQAKNCIITPHIAWAPKEARQRLMQTAANNLNAFINGKIINAVN